MIYTSYFAKLNKLPDNIIPICICAGRPKFYSGIMYSKLAPLQGFLGEYKYKDHSEANYIVNFNTQVLSQLNPKEVVEELYQISDGKDVALICYEKPTAFCHRHLVADGINANTSEHVEEYKF